MRKKDIVLFVVYLAALVVAGWLGWHSVGEK